MISTDPEVDIQQKFYKRVNSRAHSGGVKTLISIGGGENGQANKAFNELTKTSSGREKFISCAINFARKYGFGGVDLDWEFPTNKANFGLLLKDFRSSIVAEAATTKKNKLLLSAAVSGWVDTVLSSYSVPTLDKYLDWASVMAYDFHGLWESTTGLHSVFIDASNPDASVVGCVKRWLNLWLSRKKLVVGLPAYGHSWILKDSKRHGIGAPALKTAQGGPIWKDNSEGT